MKYFDAPMRVRYAETDRMGISYHGSYIVWFEAARSELFRMLNVPYTDFEKNNIFLPVVEVYCKFVAPTYYDDLIFIRISVAQLKMSTMKFTYQALNEKKDTIVAWGYTTHIFIGADQRPIPVPQEVKDAVIPYELTEKKLDRCAV